MGSKDMSEHRVEPHMFIVHDPTAFGAFDHWDEFDDENELLRATLFREHPNVEQLHHQHAGLVETLQRHATVSSLSELLDDEPLDTVLNSLEHNANYMFTHDALITVPWIPGGYFLGNMRRPLRQSEPTVMALAAERLGLNEIIRIPSELHIEGGDVMPFCYGGKRALIVGFGPRTAQQTLYFLRDSLVRSGVVDEIIGVELEPWRLNLDGCFFPVSHDVVVCHPGSIRGGLLLDSNQVRAIDPIGFYEQKGFTFVEASREESFYRQACNFICVSERKLIAYNMTERINQQLRQRGIEVISVPGDELVKGNGGPHCMTRPIYLG